MCQRFELVSFYHLLRNSQVIDWWGDMENVSKKQWIQSKLSQPWSASRFSAHITKEFLQSIRFQFHSFDVNTKCGILFSFLCMSRKVITDELKYEVEDIIQIGCMDDEAWVRVLSQILKDYPTTLTLNSQLEMTNDTFAKAYEELKEKLQMQSICLIYPRESMVLNSQKAQQPQHAHFKLKDTTRVTEEQRKERLINLTQRGMEVMSPIAIRLPSVAHGSISSASGNKKGTGASFLRHGGHRPLSATIGMAQQVTPTSVSSSAVHKRARTRLLDMSESVNIMKEQEEAVKRQKIEDEERKKKEKEEKQRKKSHSITTKESKESISLGEDSLSVIAVKEESIIETNAQQASTSSLCVSISAATTLQEDTDKGSIQSFLSNEDNAIVEEAESKSPVVLQPTNHEEDQLFEQTNILSLSDRNFIQRFLRGQLTAVEKENEPIRSLVIHEEYKTDVKSHKHILEQIIFEMNLQTGEWRKLRCKKTQKKNR